MDGNGVWRFPEGSGRQGRVERYCCNIIWPPRLRDWDEMRRDDMSYFLGWFTNLIIKKLPLNKVKLFQAILVPVGLKSEYSQVQGMDGWIGVLRAFQQYFSHIRTMEGWTWKAMHNEVPFRFGKNLATPWSKVGSTNCSATRTLPQYRGQETVPCGGFKLVKLYFCSLWNVVHMIPVVHY